MATRHHHAHDTAAMRAIIDIGSNTVRLVIYGGPPRAPEVLHNEKVTARLGKGVAETGLLSDKSCALALGALARYKALLALKGVERADVVATAAVRDARNGPAFLDKVRQMGLAPRLLSGEQEAETSAHGVLGAFPDAHGIVGDLGGGSLELVDVESDRCTHGVSMPLGTLRLPALRASGDRAFTQAITKALAKADWQATPGATLYLVGGSLRAFARFAMAKLAWPVDDPHGFELNAAEATKIAKMLARRKPDALPALFGVSSSRLMALPDTAALLAVLIRKLQPSRLVFSAWGLREGVLCETLPTGVKAQDPLVCGASAFVGDLGISAQTAAMVAGWTAGASVGEEATRRERLRLTATMLCLAAATIEPNLRTDHARDWALRKRWIGAGAGERAMLAVAMIANGGRMEVPVDLGRLIGPGAVREAQAWGLAVRLCRRFSGCTADGLTGSSLSRKGNALVLSVRPDLGALVNEGVERDLRTLAAHLGLKPELR
jgi:exopolyphosphatase/guanosine-5'-triphosphate,3'-diphosphate pyrophosphatase